MTDAKLNSAKTSYSTFGTLRRDNDPERVQEWLKENGFDESVRETLEGYNASDLLALTKADSKDLLGSKNGIRLFNRIVYQGQAARPKAERFTSSSASGTPRKRELCRMSQCSLDAMVQCSQSSCEKKLCMKHTYKCLLTSSLYCESCAEQQSLFSIGEASKKIVQYCVIS